MNLKIVYKPVNAFFFCLLIAFLLYGNTLGHDYALDDAIVITKNEFTKQGLNGIQKILSTEIFTGFFGEQKNLVSGGRYRPLSLVTFGIETQYFGQNPFVSHLVNLLLFALTGFLLFITLGKLLQNRFPAPSAKAISAITAILFLIHPIHTEVIANIKGRDEILALLFSLLALKWSLQYNQSLKPLTLIGAVGSFFLALLSKENALGFFVVIPVALWFFTPISRSKNIILSVALAIPVLVFLVIRHRILGGYAITEVNELMNNPFLEATATEKLATVLYTWLLYFKLLLFPHPLTFDYYPYHIQITNFGNGWVWLSIALVTGLGWAFVKGLKSKSLTSFCILGFAATFILVSNLFFTVGTFMNERFVYMPSVFWGLALGAMLWHAFSASAKKWHKPAALALISFTLIFYPIKTFTRNRAWANDYTLFTTDVKTSANSAKSNCSAGGKIWEKAKTLTDSTEQKRLYSKSEAYLQKAVKIHPTYADAWLLLGNVIFDSHKNIEASAICFINVLRMQPQHKNASENLDIVLQASTDRPLQLKYYLQMHQTDSLQYLTNYRLGVLYGRYFQQIEKSVYYLEKAHQFNPQKHEITKDLATAYGISQQHQKAYSLLKELLVQTPNDVQVLNNLGVCCLNLGYHAEAAEYFNRVPQSAKP